MPSRLGQDVNAWLTCFLTELDPETTITSIDGSARTTRCPARPCSKVKKGSLEEVPFSPFVRLFHSSPSAYLWEDEGGEVHTIHQGGEQGDAMMPLLFCLGQHAALEAIQRGMSPDEKLLAFLDDLYIVSKPQRVGTLHSAAQRELWGPLQDPGPWGQDARVEPSWSQTRSVQQVAESDRSS